MFVAVRREEGEDGWEEGSIEGCNGGERKEEGEGRREFRGL